MISHTHRFIFIHIPKSAGTSIENAFFRFASPSRGTEWATKNRAWRNRELFESINSYKEYFKFTIVRNPWDRIVSAWNHFRHSEGSIDLYEFACRTAEFIEQKPERLYAATPDNRTRFTAKANQLDCPIIRYPFKNPNTGYHVLPQTYFLQAGVDFIGRFENLQADFVSICEHIQAKNVTLAHMNASIHASYMDYYDKATSKIVSEIYAEDIENLGYSFLGKRE